MWPSAGEERLVLVIVNVFTWPQPAERFGYEAGPLETGADLKAKLATRVGYLGLDVAPLAKRRRSALST